MDGHELAEVVGAFGLFALAITVIAVVGVQVGATVRAKARLTREEEYRELAKSGVAAQQNAERRLTEIGDRLAAMETRMDSLERILQTVE